MAFERIRCVVCRAGARGDTQSMTLRLTKNDAASTTPASRIVLRRHGKCIVPPDSLKPRVYRVEQADARVPAVRAPGHSPATRAAKKGATKKTPTNTAAMTTIWIAIGCFSAATAGMRVWASTAD